MLGNCGVTMLSEMAKTPLTCLNNVGRFLSGKSVGESLSNGVGRAVTLSPRVAGPQCTYLRIAKKQATHWQAHAATVHTWKISWKPNQCGAGSGVLRA